MHPTTPKCRCNASILFIQLLVGRCPQPWFTILTGGPRMTSYHGVTGNMRRTGEVEWQLAQSGQLADIACCFRTSPLKMKKVPRTCLFAFKKGVLTTVLASGLLGPCGCCRGVWIASSGRWTDEPAPFGVRRIKQYDVAGACSGRLQMCPTGLIRLFALVVFDRFWRGWFGGDVRARCVEMMGSVTMYLYQYIYIWVGL